MSQHSATNPANIFSGLPVSAFTTEPPAHRRAVPRSRDEARQRGTHPAGRRLLTAGLVAVGLAAASVTVAPAASARPVIDSAPYCGPGTHYSSGHCVKNVRKGMWIS